MSVLRTGLQELTSELDYHRSKPDVSQAKDDKFVSIMSDFVAVSSYNFAELEDQLNEMKARVSTVYTNNITSNFLLLLWCHIHCVPMKLSPQQNVV